MERSRATRRTVAADEPLAHAKLRTGAQLIVLEASSWGVLIETTERVLPGRHLDVHIVTSGGRMLVRCRVARAYVWRLEVDAIYYRGALAFEQPIDASARAFTQSSVLASMPTAPAESYAERSGQGDIVFDERLTA